MKRKIFATFIAAVTAILCAFGLSACGGGYKPTALEKAFEKYYQAQNATITVTGGRVRKYGDDYSSVTKLDYGRKAAHLSSSGKGGSEYYLEISDNNGNRAFTVYHKGGDGNYSRGS